MNFLLHRRLANDELGSRAAGVGAMLPDLWRMADRRMRARHGVTATPNVASVQSGIAHHLEADDWFHRTAVFKNGERMLARELASVGVPKLVLFAHPAWEICLDGALLLTSDFDSALTELRDDIRAVTEPASAVEDLHGATTLADRAQFSSRMHRLREGLLAGPWLSSYQSGDGIAQCVGGMRRRFGLPTWSAEEESVTACLFDEALDRAKRTLPQLLQTRREHLAKGGR